jgi:hypothetical protein
MVRVERNKMRRAIKAATKTDQAHQDAARALGCMVCRFRIANRMQTAPQCGPTHIHHRNIGDMHGQKQIGQDAFVALGAWHHDGDQIPGMSRDQMRAIYGPSFKHHARDFRAWTSDVLPYDGKGTEAWQQYQDDIIESQQRGGK